MKTIAYFTLPLLLLFGCTSKSKDTLVLPTGRLLKVKILRSYDEQMRGYSGVKSSDVAHNQGYFFYYDKSETREFWMPDTYFNLDIIFLDENLKVIDIEKNMQAHPGRQEPIPRTRPIYTRHVLEIKASSPLAQDIVVGTTLKWLE